MPFGSMVSASFAIGALALIPPAEAPSAAQPDPMQAILADHRPRIASLSARLQCVPYAREKSGVSLRGDASTWWRQAAGTYVRAGTPQSGAVLVLKGYNNPNRGHVAFVRRVVNARKIIIDHANWLNQGEITVDVPVEDVSEAGDWSRVRVWHVPSQSWGRRTYTAQGFILPERADHAIREGQLAHGGDPARPA